MQLASSKNIVEVESTTRTSVTGRRKDQATVWKIEAEGEVDEVELGRWMAAAGAKRLTSTDQPGENRSCIAKDARVKTTM